MRSLAVLSLAALPLLAAPDGQAPAAVTSTPAILYPFKEGSALIGFRPTGAGGSAWGRATVRAESGRMRIHAHFGNLGPAARFGPGYLTYVLWAVSPLGRATNLGEVAPRWERAHVEAVTDLQDFALIVSAEPHFAVTRVSHAVVLENRPGAATRPRLETAETRFEQLAPAAYASEPGPGTRPGDPPYLGQARIALRIAAAERAEELAPAEYRAAQARLEALEDARHGDPGTAFVLARRAIQHAEEARQAAVRQGEARALAEQQGLAQDALAQAAAARTWADQEAQKARQKEQAAGASTRAAAEARRGLRDRLGRLLRTRETREGLVATVADVAFASGRSELAPASRVHLARVAGLLLAHPGLKIRILGHTDGTGRPGFNERLSRQRAETVRAFLAGQGLEPANLEAVGLAAAHPVASDASPEGRRQNRRVDLVIKGEDL